MKISFVEKINFSERLQSLKIAPKSVTKTSKRGDIVQRFLDRLKIDWNADKYGELKFVRINVRLRFMSVTDLYQFYGTCDEAKNFSKYFWWATNPKKNNFEPYKEV